MPLSSAVPTLTQQLNSAYTNARDAGSQEGASPSSVINTLANEFSQAVNAFMLQALVTTNDIAQPGQLVTPAAATTATPGNGTGTGNLL